MPRVAVAPRATKVPEIRKGDQVLILTGKDAGKRGAVERMVPPDRLVVEGLNVAKRHTKPRARQGRNDRAPRVQQGGIIDVSQPLHVSNVMIICPSCARPTRVKHTQGATRSDRVCAHCGEALTKVEKS